MPTFTAYAINENGRVREITTVDSPNIAKARLDIESQLKLDEKERVVGGIRPVWGASESTQGGT